MTIAYNASLTKLNDATIESIFSGAILVMTGSASSLVSIIVMIMIIKTPMFHNSFGYICFCQLIADFGAVFPNVFWTGPVTLFNPDDSITKGYYAARVGQLIHFFWYESIYCHLLVAINRFIAVTWPLSYK
ncbi:unnamed protein product [Cylicocyclus nassatus]|uniref:7TM GPCR serpentine receptor class x (Srx) domain-containing protein n=1 Tax=Cylicocyclus nassatus TaxID=53992 RepID=A0AA36HCM4_CYLNA|nr:unnamed protein product [Cylicocyclus nassatus]